MWIGLTLLLAAHAAIHLLGFLKWSKLAAVPQLNGPTLLAVAGTGGRVYAALWLLAFVGLMTAAVLYLKRHDGWWIAALAGVLLSQVLIVIAWHDAKFGTVANLLILLVVVMAAARWSFRRTVNAEIEALLIGSSGQGAVVEPDELLALPPPVKRWLETAGVVGAPRASTVRLKQRGQLRTAPDAGWMAATAEQYFTVDRPAFIWWVETEMLWILPVVGRDRYAAGTGRMLIKAGALVEMVDASDHKIAQGAMLRFLGEMVWFPSAALRSYIEWQAVDSRSARATMLDAGAAVSALFLFNDQGRVTEIRGDRYLGGGAGAKLTPWAVTFSQWQAFDEVEVPVRGEVAWKLAAGDFVYYRWEVFDLEYDRRHRYGVAP